MFIPEHINQRAFSYYRRLQRLQEYALSHPQEQLTLGRGASIVRLETSYFSKFFHEKAGVCFHDWVHYIRIQQAMSLLRESNMPITRVAQEVGFSNLRSFERAFYKHIDMTPRAYKKAVRPS